MKKLALALVMWAFPACGWAAHYNGTMLQTLTCAQAEYAPGATASCHAALQNQTGSTFNGTVDVLVWQRGSQLGSTTTLTISSLPAGASTSLPFTVAVPAIVEPRGYLMTARVRNSSSVIIDGGSGYIESAPSYLAFPRVGWIGNAALNTNATAQVADWLVWGVNLPIYYDVYYKAHVPAPPAGAATWTNLENQTVQRAVVNAFIADSHAAGLGIGVFQDWNAANDNWSTDGSGMLASWGMYGAPCSTVAHPAACTIWNGTATAAEQTAIGDTPPDWRSFGWKTNNQPQFDPSNGAFAAHATQQMRALYAQFDFDIWWIDTIGDQGASLYKANGRQINAGLGLGPSLADFVNAAIPATGRPAFMNNVDRWYDQDLAGRGAEPFVYSEIWSSVLGAANGTPLYTDINGGMARYRQATTKPVVFPAYLNDHYRHTGACVGTGLTTPCLIAEPSAHYLTAQILASGAYHAFLVDTDTMASGPYFVEQQLGMGPALMASELDLQHFGIGYENVLRDGVGDSLQPCSISGGPPGSAVGAAGGVYTLPKQKLGMSICHLLNYVNVPDTHWKDENGTYPAPPVYGPFTAKMYYTGTLARVWWASPDINHGEPVVVPSSAYTAAFDGVGTYVTFTVPSLDYWTMMVVEDAALSGASYDFDPSQLVHGSQVSHNMGPISTYPDLLTGQASAFAEYDGAEFGSTGYSHVTVTYSAASDTQIEFRVDSSTGPLLASIVLPNTGGPGTFQSIVVPASPVGGRHRLFLVFPSRPANIGVFQFFA